MIAAPKVGMLVRALHDLEIPACGDHPLMVCAFKGERLVIDRVLDRWTLSLLPEGGGSPAFFAEPDELEEIDP